MSIEHKIGEIYDTPRPCPECGNTRGEYRTAATDYGAWWKCTKCGAVFGSYEKPHGIVSLNIGAPNITAIEERLSDLEKRVVDLEFSFNKRGIYLQIGTSEEFIRELKERKIFKIRKRHFTEERNGKIILEIWRFTARDIEAGIVIRCDFLKHGDISKLPESLIKEYKNMVEEFLTVMNKNKISMEAGEYHFGEDFGLFSLNRGKTK